MPTLQNQGPAFVDQGTAMVILDFAEALDLIHRNADSMLGDVANEKDSIQTLFNQLVGDFVYINDAEAWPQDFEAYYRSLFSPRNQGILDRLFELIEETVVTHLPYFKEAGRATRNEIYSFAFANENSTVVHMTMPDWVFKAFTQPGPVIRETTSHAFETPQTRPNATGGLADAQRRKPRI